MEITEKMRNPLPPSLWRHSMIEDEFAGHKQHTRPRARSARGPDRGVAMHTYVYTYVLT